ncbi:MAG: biopolymer transporter ExbD [Terrimicrobiaceae bacterium]|jgi:biopolymer transport protein ExbD|nr:biopolymer transporter ExbD [Terrimicrobiaceae bacterium]
MAGGGVSEDGDIGFQIAPMVDVVFVLLLFFMSCAGSQIIEMELNINLPSGRPPTSSITIPSTPIIIDIFPDGKVQSSEKVFDSPTSKDLPELKAWLKDTIAKFGDKDPVIIRPDPQTRHERIMDVLNAASASGVTKLSFS